MWSYGVVPGNEQRDRQRPLGIGSELIAIRALALDRADEPLGPAVRPRVPSLCPGVPDPGRATGVAEGEALVRRAVVAEHPLHPDALASEERNGPIEERRTVAPVEARPEFGEGQPAGHIDRHVQVLPADSAIRVRVEQTGSAATALDAPEALDVEPHELAGTEDGIRPEAPRRLGEQVAQPVGPVPAEDPVDRARMEPEGRADPIRSVLRLQAEREHGPLER